MLARCCAAERKVSEGIKYVVFNSCGYAQVVTSLKNASIVCESSKRIVLNVNSHKNICSLELNIVG